MEPRSLPLPAAMGAPVEWGQGRNRAAEQRAQARRAAYLQAKHERDVAIVVVSLAPRVTKHCCEKDKVRVKSVFGRCDKVSSWGA